MTTQDSKPWWATSYPDRYYAYANTTVTLGGDPTVGWVDVAMFSSAPAWLPAASDLVAQTDAAWSARSLVNQIIKDGKVQTYALPADEAAQGTSASTSASTQGSTATA